MGKPTENYGGTCRKILYLFVGLSLFSAIADMIYFEVTKKPYDPNSIYPSRIVDPVIFWLFVFIGARVRYEYRKKYKIPFKICNDFVDDCCTQAWCWCCSSIQM